MPVESGARLTIKDIDSLAKDIGNMWRDWLQARSVDSALQQELRAYLYATDTGTTSVGSAANNRVHIPKITQISDTLQSIYWEALFSERQFFKFDADTPEDKLKAPKIDKWLSLKLEKQKFREDAGRDLVADYVNKGNAFVMVDWKEEVDARGNTIFKGPVFRRIDPDSIVFDPRPRDFSVAAKIIRSVYHISDVLTLADNNPHAKYDKGALAKIKAARKNQQLKEWEADLQKIGIAMDGFGDLEKYYRQDYVEILTYRGDVYNRETGEVQRNRIIQVADRMFVIRNEPSASPLGMSGIYHAPWRKRTDNLWGQGPLDQLVGLQYRMDQLENLKADSEELLAAPPVKIKGDGIDVSEIADGVRPHARIYITDDNSDIEYWVPEVQAIIATNSKIDELARQMEDFAGVPQQVRGIRTPGEKTAFEVSALDQNADKLFKDKTHIVERMLEGALKEAHELLMMYYDGEDYIETYGDITGAQELQQLALDDARARGDFIAMGSKHWDRRNKVGREIVEFMRVFYPELKQHVSSIELAQFTKFNLGDSWDKIIGPFFGIRDEIAGQQYAQSESQAVAQYTGEAEASAQNNLA